MDDPTPTDPAIVKAFDYAISRLATIVTPGTFYVTLWQKVPFYGGPEEGGWWGSDHIPLRFAKFNTQEEANRAHEAVNHLAHSLTRDERHEHQRRCMDILDWCDERNIDDDVDIFGEDDGPSEFYVTIELEIPQPLLQDRHYG